MAKYLLDEKQRVDLSRGGKELRVFICLNENHPMHGDELRNDDIEQYLGCPLAVINPWNVKKKPTVVGHPAVAFCRAGACWVNQNRKRQREDYFHRYSHYVPIATHSGWRVSPSGGKDNF